MYRIPIHRVMLVREGSLKADEKIVKTSEDAYNILAKYLEGQDRENFVVIMLNAKHKIISINTVSVGSLNSSIVHPREVFKPAILANAASIILGHNHPSGNPEPSADDIELTLGLMAAGELLKIRVLDHIIVGDGQYYSAQEHGDIRREN